MFLKKESVFIPSITILLKTTKPKKQQNQYKTYKTTLNVYKIRSAYLMLMKKTLNVYEIRSVYSVLIK